MHFVELIQTIQNSFITHITMKLLWQIIDWVPYGRCYMVSNLNCMSLLTGKEISIDLYRSFLKEMISKWHNPKYWKLFTAWPDWTLPRRKKNMGDTIIVNKIELFSARFWVNVIKGRPMVISINVWNQFINDREDGILTRTIFDDKNTGHATVLKGLRIYDSRSDQKTYSFTREYLTNVKGLFKSRTVLEFKIA